jgi:hypothetical protein
MKCAAFKCNSNGKVQYMVLESPNLLRFASGFPVTQNWYKELHSSEREFYVNCEQHYENFVKRASLSMEKLQFCP